MTNLLRADTVSRATKCGSGPNCPLEGPPIAIGGPFSQAPALPSPPLLPPPPYVRETGTVWQIGVFYSREKHFGAQKVPLSGDFALFNSDSIKYSAWATFIENVVRNRRK